MSTSYVLRLIPHDSNTLFRYLVFSDSPGAKIGNGGATMHAFEQLEMVVGWEELKKGTVTETLAVFTINVECAARVLLLHAGGYSQRLPSVSVVGKIFMGLPCGILHAPVLFPNCYAACYFMGRKFNVSDVGCHVGHVY